MRWSRWRPRRRTKKTESASWTIVPAIGGGALLKVDDVFVIDPATGVPVMFSTAAQAERWIEA